MLHKAERRTATTKTVRETEAEAVAFVIGKTIGLETGRASADCFGIVECASSQPRPPECSNVFPYEATALGDIAGGKTEAKII